VLMSFLSSSWPELILFNCSKTACSAGSIFDPTSDNRYNAHCVLEQLFSAATYKLDVSLFMFTTISLQAAALSSCIH
jgi:hypothetical protein